MDQPRRLLHIVQRYAPYEGGSENYVRELSERFAADGHAVTVLTTDAWDLEYFWNPAARRVDAPPDETLNGVARPALPGAALSRLVARLSRRAASDGRVEPSPCHVRQGGRSAAGRTIRAVGADASCLGASPCKRVRSDPRRQYLDRIDRPGGCGGGAAGAHPARRHTLRPSRAARRHADRALLLHAASAAAPARRGRDNRPDGAGAGVPRCPWHPGRALAPDRRRRPPARRDGR